MNLHHRFQSNLLLYSDPEDEPGLTEAGEWKDEYQNSQYNT